MISDCVPFLWPPKKEKKYLADEEDPVPWNSRKPRTVRVDQSCRIILHALQLQCMPAE
jgi:hypothetical protein